MIINIEVFKEIFSVNVFGPINLSRIVLRHFLENKKGQFVVLSSAAGKFGAPFSGEFWMIDFGDLLLANVIFQLHTLDQSMLFM